VVFASEALLPALLSDESLTQVENVASLPGIVRASYAMPDVHRGYGFPIGGVAATDVDDGGVVSPGGVGFDISCGVRLLASSLRIQDCRSRIEDLIRELSRHVPAGQGPGAIWRLQERRQLDQVMREGARAAVAAGFGTDDDLAHSEDHGALALRDTSHNSEAAVERGIRQLGSLGSGNHFLEIQFVECVFDAEVAGRFGLEEGSLTVMIHSGSRGLGHQVCSDHVREMVKALPTFGIELPDQQLAAAPVTSALGQNYLVAMAGAANYGRANRQLIAFQGRRVFERVLGAEDLRLVYDVSHNLAKLETHDVDGRPRRLCVHRKGATLALPADHPDLPEAYRATGHPVLVPGSMGTASYVLVGEPTGEVFHSTCHGAGRVMSRRQAMKTIGGHELVKRLRERGIVVMARALKYLPEEQPQAYKDVDEVVRTCEGAGLSRRVARLRPLGVLKG